VQMLSCSQKQICCWCAQGIRPIEAYRCPRCGGLAHLQCTVRCNSCGVRQCGLCFMNHDCPNEEDCLLDAGSCLCGVHCLAETLPLCLTRGDPLPHPRFFLAWVNLGVGKMLSGNYLQGVAAYHSPLSKESPIGVTGRSALPTFAHSLPIVLQWFLALVMWVLWLGGVEAEAEVVVVEPQPEDLVSARKRGGYGMAYAITGFIGILTLCGYCCWKCRWTRKVQTRTVAVQSQCTYTSVRGCQSPRFQVLPENAQGVGV
jgi:hypothetical protein